MPDFKKQTDAPWYDCSSYIEKIIITNGGTSMETMFFSDCSNYLKINAADEIIQKFKLPREEVKNGSF